MKVTTTRFFIETCVSITIQTPYTTPHQPFNTTSTPISCKTLENIFFIHKITVPLPCIFQPFFDNKNFDDKFFTLFLLFYWDIRNRMGYLAWTVVSVRADWLWIIIWCGHWFLWGQLGSGSMKALFWYNGLPFNIIWSIPTCTILMGPSSRHHGGGWKPTSSGVDGCLWMVLQSCLRITTL